jgi:hypothetical protein
MQIRGKWVKAVLFTLNILFFSLKKKKDTFSVLSRRE